jgi:hypothetical protein
MIMTTSHALPTLALQFLFARPSIPDPDIKDLLSMDTNIIQKVLILYCIFSDFEQNLSPARKLLWSGKLEGMLYLMTGI